MSDNKSLVKIDAAPLVTSRPTSNALTLHQNSGTAAYGPESGPANPFRANDLKRKNVPTGHAQEVALSDYTFKAAQQAFGKPVRGTSQPIAKRQKRGEAGVVDGPSAYKGPWARYEHGDVIEERAAGDEEEPLGSDEEYVEVYEDEIDESGQLIVGSQALVPGPMPAAATGYSEDKNTSESTVLHVPERDYMGRTYMEYDKSLNLDTDPETIKRYVPKKLIQTWKSHTKAITSLNFFPRHGHLLLSASSDSTIKLWDCYHERNLLRDILGHNKAVTSAIFNTNGAEILSASFDRQCKLFDTETGQCKGRYSVDKTPNAIAWIPNTDQFLVAAGRSVLQIDVRSGETVQTYEDAQAQVSTILTFDESRRFAVASDDRAFRAYELGVPVPIKLISQPDFFGMTASTLSPNGKYGAFQSGDDQIMIFSMGDKIKQNRKKNFRGHHSAGYAIDVEFSPDGEMLLSGDSGGECVIWDWKKSSVKERWKASEGPVTRVRFSPQETSKVATAGLDGIIKYWD